MILSTNNLVCLQRQAVVKDRPDGYVEEYLVAAEDKHHLEEHDGGGPEQAPADRRSQITVSQNDSRDATRYREA